MSSTNMSAPLPHEDISFTDQAVYNRVAKPPTYFIGGSRYSLSFDFVPTVTQSDIDKQSFTRYFARTVSSDQQIGEIIEINQVLYNQFQKVPLYQVISIPWRIVGKISDVYSGTARIYTGVATSNTLNIQLAEQTLPGIRNKLKDPLQFFQHE